MTNAQAYQKVRQRLLGAGYDTAEAQAGARILLEEMAGAAHVHLTRPDAVLSPTQQFELERSLEALEQGRPLAYLLGNREFYGLEFRCDERALIPRPETELLVEAALKELAKQRGGRPDSLGASTSGSMSTPLLADLGTGSGCIAIALAANLSDAEIYATDISPGALELARENARSLKQQERIRFLSGQAGEWAAPLLSEEPRAFDLLISNPPYIAPCEIEKLQVQVRSFEPRSALDGGEDGLDCYRQLAAQCQELLKPDGALLCELGAGQFDQVRAIFEEHKWSVENPIFDFAGIARILIAHPEAC